jgi:serine/threonine-protein kinase
VTIGDTESDIWTYDIARGTLTRLAFEGTNDTPVWVPGSKDIVYGSTRSGFANLFSRSFDGSGDTRQLTSSENPQWANSSSSDGGLLAYTEWGPTTQADVWVLSLRGDNDPLPFLQTPSQEKGAMFSPDRKWLAYMSNESGRDEVYIRPFPGPGGKWQISTGGGSYPVWARNGKELFYRNGDKMMAVDVDTQTEFRVSEPRLLFEGHYLSGHPIESGNYDVSPDGERFVMIEEGYAQEAYQLKVVLNWHQELKRLAPPN